MAVWNQDSATPGGHTGTLAPSDPVPARKGAFRAVPV